MGDEGAQDQPGDAVRELRDGWRTVDEAGRRKARMDGPSDEDDERRERNRRASLDSLDRIRAGASYSDLETRRAADAAEREIERDRRRANR